MNPFSVLALGAIISMMGAAKVHATTYVFTPGQAAKVINRTADGYVVSDLNNGGNTQVMDVGGVTVIYGGGRPTSFIMDGGDLGRSFDGVLPTFNPSTGGIDPVVPMPNNGLPVEFTE